MEHSNKPVIRPSGAPVKFDVNGDKTLVQRGLVAAQSLGVVQSAQYFYESGRAKYAEGAYQEAVEYFRRAVSLSSFFPEAYYYLGLALRSAGGPGEADVNKSFAFGFIRWRGPNIDQAIAAFRTAVAQRKDYPEAHLQLGLTLCPFGDDEDSETARTEIQRAVLLRLEHFPEGHLIWGAIQYEKGKSEEAKSEFNLALSQDPALHCLEDEDNVCKPCMYPVHSVRWCRAHLLHMIGDYEKSLAEYQIWCHETEVLGNEGRYIECFENLGDINKAMKHYPAAVNSYQTAIGLTAEFGKDEPLAGVHSALLHYKLGEVYFESSSFQDAIREFQVAIGGSKVMGSWWRPHHNLGYALWEVDRHREAVEEYSIALQASGVFPKLSGDLANQTRQFIRNYLVTLKDIPRLIAYGKKRGFLRREEIKKLVPELAQSAALLDALVTILTVDEGINIISGEKQQ